ncbi:TPA: hypothetical protein ACIADX_005330 [Escherichia coli]|nr:hypothetical protein [Escherichia coli]
MRSPQRAQPGDGWTDGLQAADEVDGTGEEPTLSGNIREEHSE